MSDDDDNDRFFDAPTVLALAPADACSSAEETGKSNDARPTAPPLPPPPPPTPLRRHRSLSRPRKRSQGPARRLSVGEPAVPPIPARFLVCGHPPFINISSFEHSSPPSPACRMNNGNIAYTLSALDSPSDAAASPTSGSLSPANGHAIAVAAPSTRQPSKPGTPTHHDYLASGDQSPDTRVHSPTLSKLESRAEHDYFSSGMARAGRSGNEQPAEEEEDLFAELADDQTMAVDGHFETRRRALSRTSHVSNKRHSMPYDVLASLSSRRTSTSGNPNAPAPSSASKAQAHRRSVDFQRHMDQYRSPLTRTSIQFDDPASISGRSASGRARRFSVAPDRSPISPSSREPTRSPELMQHTRGRQPVGVVTSPSRLQKVESSSHTFESLDESPSGSSDPKQAQTESSVESQTAETVWDELDDLKSRIKKLELTGNLPQTAHAAGSGDSSDRPRTATTAPTTIDSSPKHERKQETVVTAITPPSETVPGESVLANIHPPLHSALAKAKPLLTNALFRSLDATANDALQLSAMTSNGGPQGSVSDRHLRRKVDTMCRNLTDLCLALCEGKHEKLYLSTSPKSLEPPSQRSPSLRYSPSNLSQRLASGGRPMSRLEARKSSILGLLPDDNVESMSPRGSFGDTSEQENTPTHSFSQPPRRLSRNPSLLRGRAQQQQDLSGDEDTTIRPVSRAMTDIGRLRASARVASDSRSPGTQRTPSLRESLARRNNETAFDSNTESPRVSSLGSDLRRRRFYDQQFTPPVVEEEGSHSEYQSSSQSRRRTNANQYSSRRATGEYPSRTASLNQKRHVLVE